MTTQETIFKGHAWSDMQGIDGGYVEVETTEDGKLVSTNLLADRRDLITCTSSLSWGATAVAGEHLLALSILCRLIDEGEAIHAAPTFRIEVIQKLDRPRFTLTSEQVHDWLIDFRIDNRHDEFYYDGPDDIDYGAASLDDQCDRAWAQKEGR